VLFCSVLPLRPPESWRYIFFTAGDQPEPTFVVTPAKASYETARTIVEPVYGAAREEEILRDHRRDSRSLAGFWASWDSRRPATTPRIDRLIEGRPMIRSGRGVSSTPDKGVLARAIAPDMDGTKDPIHPRSRSGGRQRDAASCDRSADVRLLFAMQLFVGDPLFPWDLATPSIPQVIDYIKSI